jgi:hypothetical protein
VPSSQAHSQTAPFPLTVSADRLELRHGLVPALPTV